jgi:three-Cys-motif partner protein
MPAPHAAVKHELLVRYLDAWTPAALHGHRRVTYVEGQADGHPPAESSALAALRVFGEFADLLERHQLTMVLCGSDATGLASLAGALSAEVELPPGLTIHTAAGGWPALVPALKATKALGSPIFGWFDGYGLGPPPFTAVSTVGGNKASEVLVALDPSVLNGLSPADGDALFGSRSWRGDNASYPGLVASYREALRSAGLTWASHVELVDKAGSAQLLVFGTSSERALEKFKDELWALDEYAGIRYRDPQDEEHTLLDISLQPHVAPLRRALFGQVVHTGESTVSQLRSHTVRETVYRAADATRALQTLVASGSVQRQPTGGRLTADTVIRPTRSDAVSDSAAVDTSEDDE